MTKNNANTKEYLEQQKKKLGRDIDILQERIDNDQCEFDDIVGMLNKMEGSTDGSSSGEDSGEPEGTSLVDAQTAKETHERYIAEFNRINAELNRLKPDMVEAKINRTRTEEKEDLDRQKTCYEASTEDWSDSAINPACEPEWEECWTISREKSVIEFQTCIEERRIVACHEKCSGPEVINMGDCPLWHEVKNSGVCKPQWKHCYENTYVMELEPFKHCIANVKPACYDNEEEKWIWTYGELDRSLSEAFPWTHYEGFQNSLAL